MCELISEHPKEGFDAACMLMQNLPATVDKEMAECIVPIVCSKIKEKNMDSLKAVRKLVESRGVNKEALRVMADWMHDSDILSDFFVSNTLVDIYWRLGDSEYNSEMMRIAEESAANGNPRAMARIGKMYYRGKCYKKDLSEAEKWALLSYKENVPWARANLKDILDLNSDFKSARNEACKHTVRMFDLAVGSAPNPKGAAAIIPSLKYFAESGNVSAMIRIAKAYY